jgi:hypothetical protein
VDALRFWLQIGALAIIAAGPPSILTFWYLRIARLPTFVAYAAVSAIACGGVYWLLFYLAEYVLELQFREIVPGGEWTDADALAWTVSERRVVDTYFGDGGRNVFALVVPFLLLAYSMLLWILARGFYAAFRRRAA